MTATIDSEALAERGFTVIDFLEPRQIRSMRRLFRDLALRRDHRFFASPAHAYGPVARQFDLAAKALIADRVHELLPDHELFLVAAITKGSRRGEPVIFHHDWTYTDERRHRPVFFWCPMVPTGPHNGGLRIVAGSHRWATGIRPSRDVEVTEPSDLQVAFERRAQTIETRSGQAIVFDPAVIHGSSRNRSWRPRYAFTAAAAPRGADLMHFHLDDRGQLTGAVVDEAFFTTNPYGTAPMAYPAAEPWTREVSESDLAAQVLRSHP